MNAQPSIFGADNSANAVQVPSAPRLTPHTDWPYPGMTPLASAQAAMSSTEAYHEMLAAVIKTKGGARLTTKQVLAAVPTDWRELCGKYTHANLPNWTANAHEIEITYVSHEGCGGHFEYMAKGGAA